MASFDVLTDSWAVGPRLSYPLIRTRRESLQLDGGFTAQDARVGILGSGFSHDQWRVLDLSATYLFNNWLGGNWATTLGAAQGLPIFGATPDHAAILSRRGGVTDFTKLTGLARYSVALPANFSAVLTAQGQYSFSPLITGEQISLAGWASGAAMIPAASPAITASVAVASCVTICWFRIRFCWRWSLTSISMRRAPGTSSAAPRSIRP